MAVPLVKSDLSLWLYGLHSFKYVNYNDLRKFFPDFKAVYNAPNETAGLAQLEGLKKKWGKKYPYTISNWEDVSSFFQLSSIARKSHPYSRDRVWAEPMIFSCCRCLNCHVKIYYNRYNPNL